MSSELNTSGENIQLSNLFFVALWLFKIKSKIVWKNFIYHILKIMTLRFYAQKLALNLNLFDLDQYCNICINLSLDLPFFGLVAVRYQ